MKFQFSIPQESYSPNLATCPSVSVTHYLPCKAPEITAQHISDITDAAVTQATNTTIVIQLLSVSTNTKMRTIARVLLYDVLLALIYVAADAFLAYFYFDNGHIWWGALTLGAMALPGSLGRSFIRENNGEITKSSF